LTSASGTGKLRLIMDALILAAGQGTRLKPVTQYVAKSMIPFWGKPFLEYLVNNLVGLNKIDRIVIVVNYLQEQIKDHFGSNWHGKKIVYLEQLNSKGGTADAVSYAENLIKKDFITILGDVYLSKSELKQLIGVKGIKLAVTKVDDAKNHKIVNFTQNGFVTGFSNHGQWADLGFWHLTPIIFKLIKETRPNLKNEQELKMLAVLNSNLKKIKPKVTFSLQPWVQIGDHQGVKGILAAKNYLYQKNGYPVPSSIDSQIINSQIDNSLIFGPGKLVNSKVKNSLVYLKNTAKNQEISDQIAVI